MQLQIFLILLSITLLLLGTFVFLSYRLYHSKTNVGPFSLVLLGMLIGSLGGFLTSFNLDRTKGWNPYGWWFMATFLLAILGGLLGLIIYSFIIKKRPRHK
jgi:hypothetical protein